MRYSASRMFGGLALSIALTFSGEKCLQTSYKSLALTNFLSKNNGQVFIIDDSKNYSFKATSEFEKFLDSAELKNAKTNDQYMFYLGSAMKLTGIVGFTSLSTLIFSGFYNDTLKRN